MFCTSTGILIFFIVRTTHYHRDMETRLFALANGEYFTFFAHFDQRLGKFLDNFPAWYYQIVVEVVKVFVRNIHCRTVIMRGTIAGIAVSVA